MSTIRPIVLVALLVVSQALHSTLALSQQAHQIPELAAYSRQVNQIAVQYGKIFNRTIEYDSLAYSLFDGTLSSNEADRQARALSEELWVQYNRLSEQLDALPSIPGSVKSEKLRVRFETNRAMAGSSRELARTSIISGEELVQAAIAGDEDVINRVEIRSTELLASQMRHQATLYDLQLSTEDKWQVNYYLTAAIKSETEALILILGAISQGLKSGNAEDFSDAIPQVRSWLAKGHGYIDTGRKVAHGMIQHLRASTTRNPVEQRLTVAVIEILERNVPESFEVEAKILSEIASFNEKGYVLEKDELDAFAVRLTGLEEERGRLLLERQRRLAELQ